MLFEIFCSQLLLLVKDSVAEGLSNTNIQLSTTYSFHQQKRSFSRDSPTNFGAYKYLLPGVRVQIFFLFKSRGITSDARFIFIFITPSAVLMMNLRNFLSFALNLISACHPRNGKRMCAESLSHWQNILQQKMMIPRERNNKSRRRSGAEWKSKPAGERRIIYFCFHCFAGFRREVKTSGRGMKTIWAIVWSSLLYVSVVNLSAEHFSCRTGEMLPTLNPRKHPQKRFHVKQIFMFIYRSEFMKQ